MKRKSFYLFLIICCISMISSARQRYSGTCTAKPTEEVVNTNAPAIEEPSKEKTGYDLSPVGFFVLNM